MVKDRIVNLQRGNLPFVRIASFYMMGVLLASVTTISDQQVTFMLFATGLAALGALTSYSLNQTGLFGWFFYSFLCLLGWYRQADIHQSRQIDRVALYNAQQLVAMVADEPIVKQRSIRFPAQLIVALDTVSSCAIVGKVMITLRRDSSLSSPPDYGDIIQFDNQIQDVPPAYNPNEFDYRGYLARRGIHQQAYLEPSAYTVVGREGHPVLSRIFAVRAYFVDKFRTYIRDEVAFAISSALVFGYRSEMDQATLSAFTNTGTIHVLSVSGLHVTLVFAMLTFLLKPMDRIRFGRDARFVLVLLAIWAYVVLTGLAPPILRAGIMITFFVMASWSGRRQSPINTLVASAFFVLLFDSTMLWDIGFQLSYAAMLGIFLIYPLLQRMYVPENRVGKLIVEYSYVSIAAQLTTAPAALHYFGQFPNYFLLANLLIALPTTILMYVGVALMLMPIDAVSQVLGVVIQHVVLLMYTCLQWIDRLPFSTFQGIDFTGWQLLLFVGVLVLLFIAFNYRAKRYLFVGMSALLILVGSVYTQYFSYQRFRGIKLYNVRRELAVAIIDRGAVTLFSTLDSLSHPNLLYAVHPDLRQYARMENVDFISFSSDSSVALAWGDRQLLICPDGRCTSDSTDVLVLRNNNWDQLRHLRSGISTIVDGSNSWYFVQAVKDQLGNDSLHCHVAKDNFAYVWIQE